MPQYMQMLFVGILVSLPGAELRFAFRVILFLYTSLSVDKGKFSQSNFEIRLNSGIFL